MLRVRAKLASIASALLLAFTLAQPSWAAPTPISAEGKQKILEHAERIVKNRAFAGGTDFDSWTSILSKYQSDIDSAQSEESFTRVVNRALRELGISHIAVVPPAQAKEQSEQSKVGIGIKHNGSGPSELGLTIAEIIEGGPAEKAGLNPGDTIIKVDGLDFTSTEVLRGEEGSKVTLTIRRKDGAVEDVSITRGKFRTVDPPMLSKIDDEAMILRVPTFGAGYDASKIEDFFKKAADAKFLIIDLTNNGGGAVTNMNHFLGMLLPAGTAVGTSVSRAMAEQYAAATGGDPADVTAVANWSTRKLAVRRNPVGVFQGKVAVLVSGGSASASEITAAALRELKDAILVGTETAGAVLVSQSVTLEDGFQMKVPISDYVTIKGMRLEKNPLRPDVRVAVNLQRQRLNAADRALKALREGAHIEAEVR
jgi:carboxyl-terminal processing protease